MASRVRASACSWLLLAALLAGWLALPAQATTARQDGDVHVAGIVVDYGDGRVSYVLAPFTGDEISGMDLLRASGLPLLTVDFGGMGEGVCQIQTVGCDLGSCRARLCQTGDPDSAFWHYLQGADDGSWTFAALGASGSTVRDGEVNGWYWTGTTPTDPAITLDAVADAVGGDLDAIRAGSDLEPLVVTIGGAEDDPGASAADILTGAAIVLAIAVAGGGIVWASRRRASS